MSEIFIVNFSSLEISTTISSPLRYTEHFAFSQILSITLDNSK